MFDVLKQQDQLHANKLSLYIIKMQSIAIASGSNIHKT